MKRLAFKPAQVAWEIIYSFLFLKQCEISVSTVLSHSTELKGVSLTKDIL